ncbi:helix-turn-helix domain-containing protein [Niallia sp. 03133]|uniref:helix-turn-helix domain-containing protein n=1 Tax=Niallia sp. 03133 TaxID=3458060 RepID=UPI0040442909
MTDTNDIQKRFLQFGKTTFGDFPSLLKQWKKDMKNLLKDEANFEPCQSLKAFLVIIDQIAAEHHLSMSNMNEWLHIYEKQIRDFVIPYIDLDSTDNKKKKSTNRDLISSLLNQSFVESGSAILFHKIRETISKNEFDLNDALPTAKIKEKVIEATAQVRTTSDYPKLLSSQELNKWNHLTEQALTSMDDLTADIFDIISILWMKQAAHKDQMIKFHTDDALNLRQVQGRSNDEGYQTGYRKKERDDIMKRLAALTTIWVRIERDNLKLIDPESGQMEEYGHVQFNPLFVVDSVNVAYRGDKPIGIYECSIRPGELLSNFLYGAKKSSGLLALKTLHYHPTKQKYHKRLARYLSWQWRIRQKGADYLRPYHIGGDKGLLNVMGLEPNARYGSRMKEQFEEILDTLQQDGIIKAWVYQASDWTEDIMERERNWFGNSWLKARVQIIPSDDITLKDVDLLDEFSLESNTYKAVNFSSLLKGMSAPEEIAVASIETKEIIVTPELMKTTRKKNKISLSDAAKSIGISHSTLSRFERGLIKRPLSENLDRMKEWINLLD